VQLRLEDAGEKMYNMVGFQTRMTHKEQERVFRMIPGLKNAKFARLGSLHRNTFINGPLLLTEGLSLKTDPRVYFAGQLTGVEGYLESAATGIVAGLSCLGYKSPPHTSAIGSLVRHVTESDPSSYQPMKIMWGIFPKLFADDSTSKGPKKEVRRRALLNRGREDFKAWKLSQKL